MAKTALIGALIGGVLGLALLRSVGAIFGAIVGGFIGLLVGAAMAARRNALKAPEVVTRSATRPTMSPESFDAEAPTALSFDSSHSNSVVSALTGIRAPLRTRWSDGCRRSSERSASA